MQYYCRTPTSYGAFRHFLVDEEYTEYNLSAGVPLYRTRVLYVPQRPSLLPGTPRDFLTRICSFQGRRANYAGYKHGGLPAPDIQHPIDTARGWGISEELWDRDWAALSGGESQRVVIAVALGLDTAEIILLDGASLTSIPDIVTLTESG